MKLPLITSVAIGAASALAAGSASVCPGDNTHATGAALQKILDYKKSDHQIMAGYFRSWRDTAAGGTRNKVSMEDLPDCLDIAFVFPEGDEEDTFYTTLKEKYVPTLRGRGTKVVRTINVGELFNSNYQNNAAGYQALAQHLLDSYVTPYDLDGLDIDVERSLSTAQLQQAAGTFKALSSSLGPKSGTGKLLIYDTNQNGNTQLFQSVYSYVDYVLVQSYGRSVSGLQATWNTFSRFISSKQYLIGFSFYEEGGANWGDVNPPVKTSRAGQYAAWQPSGARKGGIFSYAIDRDGVRQGDDALQTTDFPWTRELIKEMNP